VPGIILDWDHLNHASLILGITGMHQDSCPIGENFLKKTQKIRKSKDLHTTFGVLKMNIQSNTLAKALLKVWVNTEFPKLNSKKDHNTPRW
jgi:hypothetical protein